MKITKAVIIHVYILPHTTNGYAGSYCHLMKMKPNWYGNSADFFDKFWALMPQKNAKEYFYHLLSVGAITISCAQNDNYYKNSK